MKEMQKKCGQLFQQDCQTMGMRVIRFNGKTGIVRCHHVDKENTIQLLNSMDTMKISTVATSGTIHALIQKHLSHFD